MYTQTLSQLNEFIAKATTRRDSMGTSADSSGTREAVDDNTKPSNLWVLFDNCQGEQKCEPTMYEIDSKCLKSVVERPAHTTSVQT